MADEIMVAIPLKVAQKAKRFYRPIHPYVARRIAELRNEGKKIEEIIEQEEQPVEEKKTKKKKAKE